MNPSLLKSVIAFVDDDDDGPMEMYREALVNAGFVLRDLRTVAEALSVASDVSAERPPDLWIIDIMMPVTPHDKDSSGAPLYEKTAYGLSSGLEIIRRVRQHFPDVRIIVLTSITTPDILENLPLDDKTGSVSKIQILPSELVEVARKLSLAKIDDRNIR